MMIKYIDELKNRHKNRDIYVIGSGASMDFINPNFFDNKLVICVNQTFRKFNCTYNIRKEFLYVQESLNKGNNVIISEYESGTIAPERLNINRINHHNLFFYKHLNNCHTNIDTNIITGKEDMLVVSYSTLTTGIHFAAYLGAKNIIICGHDAGLLDNKINYDGYMLTLDGTPWSNIDQYKNWLKTIEDQTIKVKNKLMEIYNVNVTSINPFINFGLEGHKYEK